MVFIRECQEEFDYPKHIVTTTGKNKKEKIVEAIKKLNGSLRLSMSVQSMDDKVLENIGRKNISAEKMLDIMAEVKEVNLRTLSEVIIGLPGDTYDTVIETLRKLFSAGVDNVQMYTLMLLEGSELNTKREQEKWGFQTKWRILPRDFVQLRDGKKIIELEEVVVATNTLTYKEYLDLREIALIAWVVSHGILFDALIRYLHENNFNVFDLVMEMSRSRHSSAQILVKIFNSYRSASEDELWDDPVALTKNYENEQEWAKLLTGQAGANVIQYHHAQIVFEAMEEWIRFAVSSARRLLESSNQLENSLLEVQLSEIERYTLALSRNIFHKERTKLLTEKFAYDFVSWLKAQETAPLINYEVEGNIEINFGLSNDQIRILDDVFLIYGDTEHGRSQALKRVNIAHLWRKPQPLHAKSIINLVKEHI